MVSSFFLCLVPHTESRPLDMLITHLAGTYSLLLPAPWDMQVYPLMNWFVHSLTTQIFLLALWD